MLITKTRTTIIALVAAFSFAAASMVPTVAQARKYVYERAKQSALDNAVVAGPACDNLRVGYNFDLAELEKAHARKDDFGIKFWRNEANGDYNQAYGMGCGWAARVKPPESSPTWVVGGAIQGAPEGGTPPPINVTTGATFSP